MHVLGSQLEGLLRTRLGNSQRLGSLAPVGGFDGPVRVVAADLQFHQSGPGERTRVPDHGLVPLGVDVAATCLGGHPSQPARDNRLRQLLRRVAAAARLDGHRIDAAAAGGVVGGVLQDVGPGFPEKSLGWQAGQRRQRLGQPLQGQAGAEVGLLVAAADGERPHQDVGAR
jgi:hypothetical protein